MFLFLFVFVLIKGNVLVLMESLLLSSQNQDLQLELAHAQTKFEEQREDETRAAKILKDDREGDRMMWEQEKSLWKSEKEAAIQAARAILMQEQEAKSIQAEIARATRQRHAEDARKHAQEESVRRNKTGRRCSEGRRCCSCNGAESNDVQYTRLY